MQPITLDNEIRQFHLQYGMAQTLSRIALDHECDTTFKLFTKCNTRMHEIRNVIKLRLSMKWGISL